MTHSHRSRWAARVVNARSLVTCEYEMSFRGFMRPQHLIWTDLSYIEGYRMTWAYISQRAYVWKGHFNTGVRADVTITYEYWSFPIANLDRGLNGRKQARRCFAIMLSSRSYQLNIINPISAKIYVVQSAGCRQQTNLFIARTLGHGDCRKVTPIPHTISHLTDAVDINTW